MSVLSDRLKEARDYSNLKQTQVKERTGINNKTLSGYENGVSVPDPDTLSKLADLYDVSVDYLIGRTDKKHYYDLTEKDEKDIAKDMENLVNELNGDSALAFDGEPMDEETKRLVAQAIESNLRMAKQLAKKKFTPKKYRDQE
ncbi:helix-turn-helix domain-containing protein [Sporolactobacillus laevolacticus]|uniref:Cro/Cl family transcriptional regulator n=1 Tax=Sporolactobacillus laevolacticus DSM 442 TaxID=1395513 RepID=V6IWY3_9BACL|nr:helix-turn-helix transcriptional regulator [Sporolactobacillus laevolacticus]EST11121.1 Cro/Cl family transcriptional regulator [Sporolactobacillus laevolacticus DSM 442]